MKINFILFCLKAVVANIPISTFLAPYANRGRKVDLCPSIRPRDINPMQSKDLCWTGRWTGRLKNEEKCVRGVVNPMFCALPSCFFDKKGCGQMTKNSLFFLIF